MSYEEKHFDSYVSEPLAVYLTKNQAGTSVLGLLDSFLGFKSNNDFDVIRLSRQGLSKKSLLAFAKKLSITLQEFAHILHISERTLQRYDDDALIKTEYAEKAVELARLYTRGEEVFGSMDKFKTWMKTPAIMFNNETPLSFLDTSTGFSLVFNELGRIEYGVFA